MVHSESSLKKEIHSITGLPQETRKISNKQSNFTLKRTKKEQQTKPSMSRRKEIINTRAEINEIESKKQYKRSMNPRTVSLKR